MSAGHWGKERFASVGHIQLTRYPVRDVIASVVAQNSETSTASFRSAGGVPSRWKARGVLVQPGSVTQSPHAFSQMPAQRGHRVSRRTACNGAGARMCCGSNAASRAVPVRYAANRARDLPLHPAPSRAIWRPMVRMTPLARFWYRWYTPAA